MKSSKRKAKDPVLSPKYKPPNLRDEIIENAVHQAMITGQVKDAAANKRSGLNASINSSISFDQNEDALVEAHKTFYENRTVMGLAKK